MPGGARPALLAVLALSAPRPKLAVAAGEGAEEEDCLAGHIAVELLQRAWKPAVALKGAQAKAKPPHLIFVLLDDLGFNDFYASPDLGVSWPFTRSILKDSIVVNSTYTEASCAPSRAAFMSGRYSHLLNDDEFSGSETTIAQKLNEVGYMSYAVGKWHLGWQSWSATPLGRGFHRYLGNLNNMYHYTHCSPMEPYFEMTYLERYPFKDPNSSMDHPYFAAATEVRGHHDAVVYDRAAQTFIQEHKAMFPDKPFFLYYAMFLPHGPYQTDAFWKQNCSEVPAEARYELCGMQAMADSALRNLTALLQTFKEDNYVVIITNDNGAPVSFGSLGWGGWGNNLPLRGTKFEDWEGGVRTRALVWGKHPELAASRSKGETYMGGFMHLVDWHATLAELGGVQPRPWRFPPSGVSMWRALLQNAPSPRNELFMLSGRDGIGCYRRGMKVLVVNATNFTARAVVGLPPRFSLPWRSYKYTDKALRPYTASQEKASVEIPVLYNIAEDVGQSKPLYSVKELSEMTAALLQWWGTSGECNPDEPFNSIDLDQGCSRCQEALEALWMNRTFGRVAECGGHVRRPYVDGFECSCDAESAS